MLKTVVLQTSGEEMGVDFSLDMLPKAEPNLSGYSVKIPYPLRVLAYFWTWGWLESSF